MSEAEDDGYRERLAAQTLRWRLGIGVSVWGIALASAAFVALVLLDASFVHVEGKGRLVAYAVPTIGSFLITGYVLLRVGEIDLQTGKLRRAAPVPWSRILVLVSGMTVLAGLVIAWPLGVYTSVRAARSSCGQLVPIETLRAHSTASLSYASVSTEDGCDVGIAAEGHTSLAVVLRERPAPDDREWQALLARFHPDRREPLDLGVDASVLLENGDVFVIALREGTRASFVQLRREAFDRHAALGIVETLER